MKSTVEKQLETIFLDYTIYSGFAQPTLSETGKKHLRNFLQKFGLELK